MPRKREPDYSRVWGALRPGDRETIAALEKTYRCEWRNVPMLRQMAMTLAAINLTLRWPQLSESDSFALAYEELGIEDDSQAATRPSDSLVRLLREWRNPRTRNLRNKKPAHSQSAPDNMKA